MARFPTVHDLAAADIDEVLSLWAGLGYYRRGRNLHRAAKVVAERGGFPDNVNELMTLPGIGAYSAGAIASFAFGHPAPLVDGNVHRVVSRLLNDATPIDTAGGRHLAWDVAEALVNAAVVPAVLNEGLMELGALVCTPRAPRCEACAWLGACAAQTQGTSEEVPVKIKRPQRQPLRLAAVVLLQRGSIWLERQPEDGLFGGLWAPPALELRGDTAPEDAWRQILVTRGVAPQEGWPEPVIVSRTLTHRDLAWLAAVRALGPNERGPAVSNTGRWVEAEALTKVGTSAAVRALLAATM